MIKMKHQFEPNIMIQCDNKFDGAIYTGIPTLIVEVLSRATREREITVYKNNVSGKYNVINIYNEDSELTRNGSLLNVKESIDTFNNSNKELEDILKFKLDFVRIHPFMDGNGRLSRLIMNGLLTAKGYPRIIIRNQDKGFYYDAIEAALIVGRYDAWFKFMLTYMKFMCELEDMFLMDIE